jgi:fatty-acyl-CoA synthase
MFHEALGQTVNSLFDHSCRKFGRRTALVDGDSRVTYLELRRRVAKVTKGLQKQGVTSEDRVAFLIGVNQDWVVLFYACMRIGAVAVPLNLTWTGREIEEGLRLTETTVLAATDCFRGTDYVELVRTHLELKPTGVLGGVQTSRLPQLRKLLVSSSSGAANGDDLTLAHLVEAGADVTAEEFAAASAQVGPETDSIYLLTSGTTSFPKPVRHVHQSLLVGVAHYADGVEATAEDSILIIAPNYHVAAYFTLLMPHLRGGTVHLMSHFVPRSALEIIEREQISLLFGFDVHFLMMKRDSQFRLYDFSSVTRTMIGSHPGSFDEIEAMGVTHQGNIYGSSEYVASQTFLPYRDRDDREHMRLSHGRPSLGCELRIVDPESGATLPTSQQGEICFKGPALFRGYYNMPEETASAFDDDGFFHSGDMGFLDEAGYLYYQGRYKETVKSGGENVSMQEVELFLQLETPWVSKALVVALPDPIWGEAVTALIELRPGVEVDPEEIREFCRGRLAGYKIPKHILFVTDDDWAITPTGKFDRKAMTLRARARLHD